MRPDPVPAAASVQRPTPASVSHFRLADWRVAPEEKALERDGERLTLEPRTMQVLVYLCEHAGEVLSAEQLLQACWRGTFYGDGPVHKTIAHLRKALGDDAAAPRFIETIRKRGYRLVAPVTFPEHYRGQPTPVPPSWSDGNPFVGLRAFDARDSAVFFGRARAVADVGAALARQHARGVGFVLLLGASGCGKTSLLHAGVVPALCRPGGSHGLEALSLVAFNPGTAAPGTLLLGFAQALQAWSIHGDALCPASGTALLASDLVADPASAVAQLGRRARQRLGPDRSGDAPRVLLLCVDQLEAIVGAEGGSRGGDVERFLDTLAAFAADPAFAVVATCRSDFYPHIVADATLRRLKAGDGHYDVPPLTSGELTQAIRGPASAAGLGFEMEASSQRRLDDVLRDAAVHHPLALPLLQYTLQALYRECSARGELTFAAYAAIGGLEGALTQRAEAVFAAMPASSQAAFPELLRGLVGVSADGRSVVGRRLRWSALRNDATRALAEAFVDARLLVGELDGGERRIVVAHEALLQHWPRVREWVQENQRALASKQRLAAASARWLQEGRRRDLLLPPGRLLDEAGALLRHGAVQVSEDEHRFVRESQRRQSLQRRLRVAGVGLVIALGVAATLSGLVANRARDDAERHRLQAEGLLGFMLGELTERLRPLGRLDVLDAIGQEASAYFASASGTDDGPEARLLRSRTLRQLGELRVARADATAALDAFERAAALARAVASPEHAQGWTELGTAAFWIGQVHYRQRNFDAAHAAWSEYLHASERLVALQPDAPDAWLELSYARNNLGTLESGRGRFEPARAHFEASLALKRRVQAARPDDATLAAELADTLSWIAGTEEALGGLAEADTHYVQAAGIVARLQNAAPGDLVWSHRLATLQTHRGVLAVARGQLREARHLFDGAAATLAGLVREQPEHRGWQRDAAFVAIQRGSLAAATGDEAAAIALLDGAVRDMDALVARDDSAVEWRRLHALARLRRIQSTDVGDTVATDLDAIVTDLDALADAHPQDRLTRIVLAHALVTQGQQRDTVGGDATAAWTRALAVLANDGTPELRALDPQARALALLGRSDAGARAATRLWQAGYRDPGFMPFYDRLLVPYPTGPAIETPSPTTEEATP